MTAATLKDEVAGALRGLAWEQWSQLGVSAATPRRREERAADPEALLLFTLDVGRGEPRLFDEVLDWLVHNEALISVHRLRNLSANPTDRTLVDAALDWSSGARRRARPAARTPPIAHGTALEPLFTSLPMPRRDVDPAFARHGLARSPLQPSGKSQAPRLHDPIAFALRLRRLLGVGVRAEVVRTLLTIRAPMVSGRIITASAGFAQRNVREGLTQLYEAGVITIANVSDDRQYAIRHDDWAALLRLDNTPELPFHYDWISSLRALTRILRWLERPDLDELSPYLRASQARTLVAEIEPDLQRVGVAPGVYSRHGPDYWDEFVEIVRAAVRHARGSR